MKKLCSVFILLVLFISGCGAETKNTENPQQATSEIDTSIVIPTDTLVHDDSQYLVYFYQDGCHYCAQTTPLVEEFAKNHPDYKVYAYKIDPVTWSTTSFNQSQNGKQDDKPVKLETPMPVTNDVSVVSTPTLFYVKDGQIENRAVGDSDTGLATTGEYSVPALLNTLN